MESLYRKYRPQTFDDVVGQKHVVATLRRAVLEGRTSHAYLFCGPRGTGKTTMARLLAKALLCEQGEGHLPDGTCEQCQLIAAGEHPDVYELDAASNTGVDNVREEIINRVSYAPVRGDYKVYIIDEVHMLTPAAFNALLKTLEEPPEHVVFIMCTTDPQKVLETILSRVQRFDFRPISNDELLGRLVYVCEQEGFTYEREALELITLHARGGMRDALSDLERLATYTGGAITIEAAQDMLGEVPASTLAEVGYALAKRDVPALFGEVATLVDSGRDLLQFARELCAHLRDVYVVAAVGERPGVVSAQGEALAQLGAEARAFGSADRISRAMTVLGDASSEMRTAPNQRLVLELAFTRIARPESEITLDALAERVAVLETQLEELKATGITASPASASPQRAQQVEATPVLPAQKTAPTSVPTQRQEATTPQRRAVPQTQAPPVASVPQATTRSATEYVVQPPAQPVTQTHAQASAQGAPQRAQKPSVSAPTASRGAAITDPGDLQRRWRQVCDELLENMPSRGSLLMSSDIVSDDGTTLTVSLPKGSHFAIKMLERQDVRAVIAPLVARAFGQRQISFVETGSATPRAAREVRPTSRAQAAAQPHAAQMATQPVMPPAHEQPRVQPPRNIPTPAPIPQPKAAPPVANRQPSANAFQQQTPSPAQQPPRYPAPWDDVPPYEEVPYSEADAAPYEEDEYFAPSPLPSLPQQPARQAVRRVVSSPAPAAIPAQQQSAVIPEQAHEAAPQTQPAFQPKPAPQPKAASQPKPAPQPAPPSTPSPAQEPAPQPAQAPVPEQSPTPVPKRSVGPVENDVASIMSLLTDVFGEGVTMSKVEDEPESAGEDFDYIDEDDQA